MPVVCFLFSQKDDDADHLELTVGRPYDLLLM
jgi:hypothetical protein